MLGWVLGEVALRLVSARKVGESTPVFMTPAQDSSCCLQAAPHRVSSGGAAFLPVPGKGPHRSHPFHGVHAAKKNNTKMKTSASRHQHRHLSTSRGRTAGLGGGVGLTLCPTLQGR